MGGEGLNLQQSLRILVEDFPLGRFVRGQSADAGQNLRTVALSAKAGAIVAIGPEEEFFLMLFNKPASVLFIAVLEVQT